MCYCVPVHMCAHVMARVCMCRSVCFCVFSGLEHVPVCLKPRVQSPTAPSRLCSEALVARTGHLWKWPQTPKSYWARPRAMLTSLCSGFSGGTLISSAPRAMLLACSTPPGWTQFSELPPHRQTSQQCHPHPPGLATCPSPAPVSPPPPTPALPVSEAPCGQDLWTRVSGDGPR